MAKHANTSVDAVDPSPAAIDTLYGALADEQRRTALAALCDRAGPAAVEELARETLDRTATDDTDAVPDARRQRLSVALYHVHVPKLADAGLVSFDREEARVSVTDTGEEIRSQFASYR